MLTPYVYYVNSDDQVCSVPVPELGGDLSIKTVREMLRSIGAKLTGVGYDPIGDVD